jgi:hypothetical protein
MRLIVSNDNKQILMASVRQTVVGAFEVFIRTKHNWHVPTFSTTSDDIAWEFDCAAGYDSVKLVSDADEDRQRLNCREYWSYCKNELSILLVPWEHLAESSSFPQLLFAQPVGDEDENGR